MMCYCNHIFYNLDIIKSKTAFYCLETKRSIAGNKMNSRVSIRTTEVGQARDCFKSYKTKYILTVDSNRPK